MFLFDLFTQNIAIDLGTANTLIIFNDKVVIEEPSVVAINRQNGKILALGKEAMFMDGKTHEHIKIIRPMKDGVIADFHAAEHMIRGFIAMIDKRKRWLFTSLNMVICIPSGITEVEKRAVRDSAEIAGAKDVYMIQEPMAAAIGIGIDVLAPCGNMIVDIGGGSTEIAVIALGGIVSDKSIRIAGNNLDDDIVNYMRYQHNVLIGYRTAEKAKIAIGTTICKNKDFKLSEFAIYGRDLVTGIPKQIIISSEEIAKSIDKSISKIEESILKALEITPPELAADIYQTGIYLTGGGALLKGLSNRIMEKTKLNVHIAEDPLRAVVKGTGIVQNNIKKYSFLIQ
ncbi:MAG: rod shape-determining protein [Bacteroides sp.]|nr:MAG: rod shape-determining protein [Bacteroides sp.]